MEDQERRLTNQDHIDLWEKEHAQWSRAKGKRRAISLAIAWFVCVVGFVLCFWGASMLAATSL